MPAPVLAFVTDLIFRTKISSTARALGVELEITASAPVMVERLVANRPHLLLIDLNASGDPIAAITAARQSAPAPHIVAFVSHVQADLAAAARSAGADEVMARSMFVEKLPELLESARPADPATSSEVKPCPRCGRAALVQRQCKLWCDGCGYVESCEDLF